VRFLKKDPAKQKGLRVKEISIPLTTDSILGSGIDVTSLPEGHFSCQICKGFKFDCDIMLDYHRLEVGCRECGKAYRFLFPIDLPLPAQKGRFTCKKHPDKGMIIIHNVGMFSCGCESCATQIVFDVRKTKNNLILPEDIH
jgi:hypothetical protein